MDDKTIKICLKIIKKLKSIPYYCDFIDLIDRNQYPNYYKEVKKPVSLSTIKKNLINKKYMNIREVEEDINLIYQNSKQFNGTQHFITNFAEQLKADFDKYLKKYIVTPKSLISEYCTLYEKLDEYLKNPPPSIKSEAITNMINNNIIGETQQISKDKESLHSLKEDLSHLNSNDDQLQLLYIIKENEHEHEKDLNEVSVKLHELQEQTIQALSDYVVKAQQSKM